MIGESDLESQQLNVSSESEKKESNVVRSQCGPGGQIMNSNNLPDITGQKTKIDDRQIFDESVYGSIKTTSFWDIFYLFVKDRDVAMCNSWREGIDKLLLFAGLFSATVTAFIIESYKWLQPEPDATAQYLGFLTAQLAQAQNFTVPEPLSRLSTPPEVTSSAIRINIFWFLSLVFSLSAALIGILCYQWLREFQEDTTHLNNKKAVALRHTKFNGLQSWRIPAILSSLPLLLQLALLLFFAGILDLLWARNQIVAGVITTTIGAVFLFLVITTAAPAFQYVWYLESSHYNSDKSHWGDFVPQCPFKSPPSWLVLRFAIWIRKIGETFRIWNRGKRNWTNFDFFSWMTFDLRWQLRKFDLLQPQETIALSYAVDWLHNTWSAENIQVIDVICECLADLDIKLAEGLVRKWYQDSSAHSKLLERDLSTFRQDRERRAIISIHFLLLHMIDHPAIRPRLLKTMLQTYPRQLYPEVLDLALACIYTTTMEIAFEPETMIQTVDFLCFHCDAHHDVVENRHVLYGWEILRRLIWKRNSLLNSGNISLKDLNVHHFAYACKVSKTFQDWLQLRSNHLRANTCADGLSQLFPLELKEEDFSTLSQTFPDFKNIVGFVQFLDTCNVKREWTSFSLRFAQFGVSGDSDVDGRAAANIGTSHLHVVPSS